MRLSIRKRAVARARLCAAFTRDCARAPTRPRPRDTVNLRRINIIYPGHRCITLTVDVYKTKHIIHLIQTELIYVEAKKQIYEVNGFRPGF